MKTTIFIFAILLAFSQLALANETIDKTDAINRALAQAESKNEAAAEPETDLIYRQRLKEDVVAVTAEKEEKLPSEFDTFIRVMPKHGVKSQEGNLGLLQSDFEYSYEFKAFDKIPVELGVGTEYINIDNSTSVTLPAHLTTVAIGGNITLPFFNFNKTYFRLGITPSFYSDNWNVNSTVFRIPINALAIYQPNDKLTLILGVHIFPSGVDGKISPIAGLIYKPNDKLFFNLVAPTPTITYMFNKKIGLFGEWGFTDEEYLVTKDGEKNLALLYRNVRLGAGALYKFNNFARASFSMGSTLKSYLKYKESLGKVVMKNGLYTECRLEMYW
ncbi:MAG: hypothetical protein M0R66_08200 [Candidatus Omnitrophica bacterium]|nr:hypothetical protein [Candidatus Omnitrophota bacterium]